MMYEELVKRLRESKNNQCYIGCFGLCGDCRIDAELKQAADAIEELQYDLDIAVRAESAATEACKPCWIPVTERLPDAYEDVLLQFPNNQAAGFCDRDGCWSIYSGDGFYTEVADNEPKPTHWAKKLPEPPKEEV